MGEREGEVGRMLDAGFYNCDCMIGMKQFPDKFFELAIVDPPYQGSDAIGLVDCKRESAQAAKRTDYKLFDNIAPDETYFLELRRVSRNQIVWGGNFFGLTGGVIAWNKHGTAFGEGEVAICSTHKSVRFFDYTWNEMIQENMKDKEQRLHPTQKLIALYKWLLTNYAHKGDKIIDTHVGSASSLIACHQLGFQYWGFELDPDYYKAASERLERAKAQVSMLDIAPEAVKQLGI